MEYAGVKQWPIWKTLLLFAVIMIVGVPIIVAVQTAITPESNRDEWRDVAAADGTDGLVISKGGVDLLLYCGQQSPMAAMIRSRGTSFNLNETVRYSRPDGVMANLGGWACLPNLEACSTDGVDPSAASLLLHIAALDGSTETLTYSLEGGRSRRITYDFSQVQERYSALADRCAR